jgi:hypothetical protein
MNIMSFMDTLSSFKQDVPDTLPVLMLRSSSVDEQHRRLRKLLKVSGDACEKDFDRGDWTTFEDRTLVRLPAGANAVIYHASGAVKLACGLAPMESLFKAMESKAQLTERAEAHVKSLGFMDSMARGESLRFERLWQTKACASDRSGKAVEPVLCRAVGAFRHHIEGIPVLGPASVAVQIAGEGTLDAVSSLMRGPTSEALETVKVLHPQEAVRQMGQQLALRFGHARSEKADIKVECRDGLRFGYLSLPKRKSQRVLAPVYLAAIDVAHEQERQAFVLAVPATERNYLGLNQEGAESVINSNSKLASRRCC